MPFDGIVSLDIITQVAHLFRREGCMTLTFGNVVHPCCALPGIWPGVSHTLTELLNNTLSQETKHNAKCAKGRLHIVGRGNHSTITHRRQSRTRARTRHKIASTDDFRKKCHEVLAACKMLRRQRFVRTTLWLHM